MKAEKNGFNIKKANNLIIKSVPSSVSVSLDGSKLITYTYYTSAWMKHLIKTKLMK